MNSFVIIDFDIVILNLRERRYRYIGSGSGRQVYDLGNGYVVKVAKNRKGIAQNKAEYEIALADDSNLFASIAQVSENYGLVIMEKAEPIYNFTKVLKYFNVRNTRAFLQLEEIRYIFTEYDLLQADLCRSVNWGIINNRPVIIDYGFTRYVRRKYYSPF